MGDALAIQRRVAAELSQGEQWAVVAITSELEALPPERLELVLELACAWLGCEVPPMPHAPRTNDDPRQETLF